MLPSKIMKYVVGIRLLIYENQYYWSGVYKKFEDVPVLGEGYFEENLANETRDYTQKLIDSLKKESQLPYNLLEENTFLPLISSIVQLKEGKLKILELGGGMGIGYLGTKACLGDNIEISYDIIETPVNCRGGQELFRGNKQIRFFQDFPSDLKEVDIVFIKSALQYFKEYDQVLKKLVSYNPKYVLFVKLSAGENVTYVTSQKNLTNTITPFWFLNVGEVVSIMSTLGYSLIFKGLLDRAYNQDNFSREYQIRKNCNLLFKKN